MASRALREHRAKGSSGKPLGVLAAVAIVVLLLGACAAGALALCAHWLQDLPDYRDPDAYALSEPTRVFASDGETLLAEFQLEWRDPVPLTQISPYVIEATVATEDERFFEHAGVDLVGIARALVNNLFGSGLEGASTITQQFVRNTVLSDEMTDISLKRKVREAYIAIQLEKAYSKEEILALYLNTINYGQGAYGIEAASQRYFSKHAADLTLEEAATLAGIPQAPSHNNPIDNYDACLNRRNAVLERMVQAGYLTQGEADVAKASPLELNPTAPSTDGIRAWPYFTSYVRDQLLDSQGGYGFSTADIFEGGFTVVTTLDVSLQEDAEAASAARLEGLADAFEVSLVAIEPHTGYVKALIGGKDYAKSQVNMATGAGGSGRQAGSSFKTFTLVTAIEQGINPATLIDAGSTAKLGDWTVSNIDKRNYGTRSIASAYQVSSNTAFARLALSVGPDKVAETAHRLGIESRLSTTGSVTLGVDSVTPIEMASAYATIANAGVHCQPECILKVTDAAGEVLVDNADPQGEQVISPEVAHAALEIMEGVITQGTGTAARLASDQPVAGKTGTSEKYKDSWFCGFTPQLSVAVWLGDRSDYASALSVPQGVSAASVFSDFMNLALKDAPVEQFFEAPAPNYLPRYVDAKYHIGTNLGATSDKEKDEEEDAKEEDEASEPDEETPEANPESPVDPESPEPDAGPGEEGAPPEAPEAPEEPTSLEAVDAPPALPE